MHAEDSEITQHNAPPDHLFKLFADSIPTLAWMAKADGHITWYNRRWHDYCGTTLTQMEGWGWQSVHDPAHLPEVLKRWRASIASGQDFEMTFPLRGVDGNFRPFLTRVVAHRDQAGSIVGWFGTNTDVSFQLEVEHALEAARTFAEARARETEAILSQLAEGVIVTDVKGDITYVNRAAAMLHGAERLNVGPDDYSDAYRLLTEDGQPYPPRELPLARAVAGDTVVDARWQIARPDGTKVVALGSAQPIIDDDGNQVGAVLTMRDDTARDAVERMLRQSEERLNKLNATLEQRVAATLAERKVLADVVESTDAFVMVVGLDYTLLAINEASAQECERIYGVRPRAGDNLLALLAGRPEAGEQALEYWARALAGEEYDFIDEFGDAQHAREIYSIKFNALRDSNGRQIGAFNIATNITEQRRAQDQLDGAREQLRHAQKMEAIGQLTGGVAHDFNNLLTVISGGLDMIDRQSDPDRRVRILSSMRVAVERGSTLSRQLLAFSRRQPLRSVPLDLARQIGAMRELLGGSLRGDIHVEMTFDPELWPVAVDPGELELVILNLAVNARDAMPGGGTITIAAQNVVVSGDPEIFGEYVRLAVNDRGTGMPPEVVERVFEPFFTTKEIGKGSGLGLAQTHGFAHSSGGVVRITSEVGVGTTIALLLPRSPESPQINTTDAVAARAPTAPGNGKSILVVEDDDHVAALAVDMIAQLGYVPMRVASADAALGALADGRVVDLVFSDVVMPGCMNGVDLAEAIKKRRPDVSVVLTSGYSGAARVKADAMNIDILPKPYRLAKLGEVLSNALKNDK